jgi:hypothetical protein
MLYLSYNNRFKSYLVDPDPLGCEIIYMFGSGSLKELGILIQNRNPFKTEKYIALKGLKELSNYLLSFYKCFLDFLQLKFQLRAVRDKV